MSKLLEVLQEDTADFSGELEHHFGQNAEKAGKNETEQGAFVLSVAHQRLASSMTRIK